MDKSQEFREKPDAEEASIPAYLIGKEADDDPLSRLTRLIKVKLKNLTLLNSKGIKLLDDQIGAAFDSAIDLGLKEEAIEEMRRFKKGRQLTKEGLIYKNELERKERSKHPVLKLADLIINKMAGMDVLSDNEIRELDNSIQTAYREARQDPKSGADALMSAYFLEGRQLTNSAQDWLRIKEPNEFASLLTRVVDDAMSALPKQAATD